MHHPMLLLLRKTMEQRLENLVPPLDQLHPWLMLVPQVREGHGLRQQVGLPARQVCFPQAGDGVGARDVHACLYQPSVCVCLTCVYFFGAMGPLHATAAAPALRATAACHSKTRRHTRLTVTPSSMPAGVAPKEHMWGAQGGPCVHRRCVGNTRALVCPARKSPCMPTNTRIYVTPCGATPELRRDLPRRGA